MKRQQALITSDDVIVLDSPFIHEGELLVPFVAGQSAPVSESILTDLLHDEGPRLATALATAVCTLYSSRCTTIIWAQHKFFFYGAS